MGLDNFWVSDKKDAEGKFISLKAHPKFEPALNLCSGIFSGSGSGSFRGKAYNELVEFVTKGKHSLYAEVNTHAQVVEIAEALKKAKLTKAQLNRLIYDGGKAEFDDFVRMFDAYSKIPEAVLVAWC